MAIAITIITDTIIDMITEITGIGAGMRTAISMTTDSIIMTDIRIITATGVTIITDITGIIKNERGRLAALF
jgi:hypothetical protein